MGFTPKQKDIIKYNRVNKPIITIQEGAVRSGKTFVNLFLWWDHIHEFRGQGKVFIMTGTTIGSLQRNVLNDIENIFPDVTTTLNKNNEFQWMGNTIACFGTDKVVSYKAMKGFTAYGWLGNEVTESHKNSIDQAVKRCSGDGFRIFWDTNPGAPNHFLKTNFIDKSDSRLSNGRVYVKSHHFVLEDNSIQNGGVLTDEYIESLKLSTPSGMWYDRDILGLWVSAEGMIYKDFNLSKHTISIVDLPKDIRTNWAGVDWGYNHKGAIGVYGNDHDGMNYRIKEIAESGKDIDWWVNEAKKLKEEFGDMIFYCDPARPEYIAKFRQSGLRARAAENEVVPGISFVASLYKKDLLKIVKEYNENYLRTIFNYRWKENVTKEEPIKEDDDSQDTERYALYSHLGKRTGTRV